MSKFLDKNSKKWGSLEYLHERVGFVNAAPGSNLKVPHFKTPNGNDLRGTKRAVGKILDSLYKGESIITEEDWLELWKDIRAFNSDQPSIYKNWFWKQLGDNNGYSTTSMKTVLQNSKDDIYVMLFLDQVKYWGVSEKNVDGIDRKVLERIGPVKQTAISLELVEKKILNLSESGDLDTLTTALIGENLKEKTFTKFKVALGNKIGEKLRNVDSSVDLTKFLTKTQYEAYIGFEKIHEGADLFVALTQNIYSGDRPKILQASLSPEERHLFAFPGAFLYPDTLITKADGTIDKEKKEKLRTDTSQDGKDVANYPFEFVKDEFPFKSVFGMDSFKKKSDNVAFGWLKSFFVKSSTPQEMIKNAVQSSYFSFLKQIGKDFENNQQLTTTIGEQWKIALAEQGDAFATAFPLIFLDKIVSGKKALFDKLAGVQIDADTDGDGVADTKVDSDAREAAYQSQLDAFQRGAGSDIDVPSEEDIENRQKFFKQCALMLNMPELRDVYQQELNSKYIGKLPFDGRFTTLGCKDEEQELMLTQLVSSKKEQLLFELETHKVSRLVPKVRLFKVFHDPTDGEKEVEFVFSRTSKQRDSFLSAEFDKGNGVGLKNFSFEFNGTSPATARNDITASLTLFFQSFEDFTRSRKASDEDDYRYVDLIIQPTPDKKGEVGGVEIQSDRQYEPQFYRIRADIGYVLPTEADGFTSDEIEALRVSNKSFFLNMVDHDISFGKDGTVEIKISYRAYLESLLKHPRLDALASPELISRRIANAREFAKQVQNKECSVEQLKELQISLAAQETVLVKQSLSSIITRLTKRGAIYTALIKKEDKDFFLKKGFFKTCTLEKDSIGDGSNGVDVKLVLNSDLPESSDDFDFMDSANRSVQFFYFGDLLYTVLDCVYSDGNKVRKGTGFNRNSIILGSFEFEPFQQNQKTGNVYNIADIPVSVDFFSRWFVDNVVSQKSTRKTFPLMNFVRSFSNNLIKPALIENCVNRKLETRLRFQTSQVTAFQSKGENPLSKHYKLSEKRVPVALDVETLRSGKDPTLPLKGGPTNDANSNFKDFHTFIVLSALGSTLSFAGNGKYGEDIEQGRFHVHIGQNAGLVKTLSLSKSDQQYIREARFFQNGIDGLLQLSAVYVANIEMFGNTLFYPGMEFFFNPYGIGGPTFDPRKPTSDANKLGIGGYHTITSVKSSISPGKFTTTIAGQQYYSGDNSGNPNTVKMKNADTGTGKIEEYKPTDETENNDGFVKCNQVILNAQNYSFEEGTLAGTSAASTSGSSSPPIETAEDNDPPESDNSVEAASNEELGESADSAEATSDEELGESNVDPEVVVITEESQSANPEVVETFSGQLKTMKSSQTSTSSTGGQLVQSFTEEAGRFTEMSDGTIYFERFNQNGVFGPKLIIRDNSRIIRR